MPGFDARPDRHPVGKKQNNPIGEGETRRKGDLEEEEEYLVF